MVSAKALLLSAGFSLSGAAMAAETPYFQTGFESEADFAGFYITPVKPGDSDGQELSRARRHSGEFSHHAWIVAPNPESTLLANSNHRAYPTIQFQNRSSGPVPTPICTTFYVWADFGLYAAPSIEAGEIFNDDLTIMPGLCGL